MAGEYKADGSTSWYDETKNIDVLIGDKATSIDKVAKTVISEKGTVRFRFIKIFSCPLVDYVSIYPGSTL